MEERERKLSTRRTEGGKATGKSERGQRENVETREERVESQGEASGSVSVDSEPREQQQQLDSRLDICSEQFDPELALYSSTVVPLPFPNIKCFNNVAEYESFLKGGRGRAKPENVEKRQRAARKGVADPERIARLKELMVKNPTASEDAEEGTSGPRRLPRRQKTQKNVLTRMPLMAGSPLGSLNRCVQEHVRVKVHIRTFKGLRGVCSGFVVAFDKFWNLAMVDVDETYREPLLGQALYHEKALTVTRLFDKLKLQNEEASTSEATHKTDDPRTRRTHSHTQSAKGGHTHSHTHTPPAAPPAKPTSGGGTKYGRVRTRHVNQLFIRGENILLINIPNM
ncbi:U7 snRNA-associated Sm-like protein LSm11 [Engraulis encrasicolus]|uniref:U7 snRNA-associated Sm-like protein LSm11 n=1 Tax=Engraulis encrasicolus TaxID=184585 RepID=UPI002FD03EAD